MTAINRPVSGLRGNRNRIRLVAAVGVTALALTTSGCAFQGLNSMPIPGAKGTGDGSYKISALIPSAANVVENAPVMMDDATVGSVGHMSVKNWAADVTLRLEKGTKVPVGSYVMVGMTSALGSLHLEIVQPENPTGGFMKPGDEIPLAKCPEQDQISAPAGQKPIPNINSAEQIAQCTYPTTEQVLSSLSVMLNGGGLAKLGDTVHELNQTLAGRADVVRDLLPRLNTVVSDLASQKDNIIDAIDGLNRLSGTLDQQHGTIERALNDGPKILQLLVDQRVHLTDALGSLSTLSRTADDILKSNGDDIRTIVSNLEPVVDQLAGSGPSLATSLGILLTFPFKESAIPNIIRGDYANLQINVNLTWDRLNSDLFAAVGAHIGPEGILGSAGTAKQASDPFTAPIQPYLTPQPGNAVLTAPTPGTTGGGK
jgi:phospholipid/cholesterol/gamma-HCH transport system substrate-binding protein